MIFKRLAAVLLAASLFIPAPLFAALTDSLISYWKLDEASGNRVDAHGSNTLTSNNSVLSGTGLVYSTAADFESTTPQWLSITDNASLSTGNIDFTLAAWVNFESLGANREIAGKITIGTGLEYSLYYYNPAQRFAWRATSADGFANYTEVQANNFGAPLINTWYFIVAWHDATANTLNIQVNNGTPNSTAYSVGAYDSTFPFRIGSNGIDEHMDGRIAPVMFWKKVVPSDEKNQLWNAGAGLTYESFAGGGGGGPTHLFWRRNAN